MHTMSFYRVSISIVLLMVIACHQTHAQDRYNELVDSTMSITRSSKLDSLVMRHIRTNKIKDGLEGYRVQLYSGSGTSARDEANNIRAEFMGNHPDIPAYLLYQTPNFKVRVGDFRTELDAIRVQRELSYQYPGGFVVKDEIKFPKLRIDAKNEEREEYMEGEGSNSDK